MRFFRQLLQIQLLAQGALILCAVLLAIAVSLFGAVFTHNGPLQIGDLAVPFGIAIATYIFGVLPVVLFGAPAYAILQMRNRATLLNVLVLGVGPGVVMLLASMTPIAQTSDLTPALAALFVVCGMFVAWATHYYYRRVNRRNSVA
jgi:hypothetical protein